MSSRQIGTWHQLIDCALFKIWSLILEGELKEQKGYLTGWLSAQIGCQKFGKQQRGYRKPGKVNQKGLDGWMRLKVGEKMLNIHTTDLHKVQVPKYKIGKTIQNKQHMVHVNLQDRHKK